MNSKPKQDEKEITLIYDKECPICQSFASCVNEDSHIKTINARESSKIRSIAEQKQFDLNRGAIAYYKGHYYFGPDAIRLVSQHSKAKNTLARLARLVLVNRAITKYSYPIFTFIRKALLVIRGIPAIDKMETEHDKNQ